jgi:hypothetical protein
MKKQPDYLPKKLEQRNRNLKLMSLCGSGEKFLQQFNFDYCADRYKHILTVRDAIAVNMITLREIAETYNEKTPELLLQAWLVNLAMFLCVEITPQQARETSRYMIEEIRSLSLPLITILFKRLKKGKYGEFYGKFNGQKILIACIDFRKEVRKEIVWLENQNQLKMLGY